MPPISIGASSHVASRLSELRGDERASGHHAPMASWRGRVRAAGAWKRPGRGRASPARHRRLAGRRHALSSHLRQRRAHDGSAVSRASGVIRVPGSQLLPRGVLRRWQTGAPAERQALDREYGIEKVLSEIDYHFSESVFVKFMVKELAGFLGCAPRLDAVVEARNARTAPDYFRTSPISSATSSSPM